MKASWFLWGLVIVSLLSASLAQASDSEEEDDQDSGSNEAEDDDQKEAEKPQKPADEVQSTSGAVSATSAAGGDKYQAPFVEDPFTFYKWPGFGQQEGVVGRLPWWPLIPYQVIKDESAKQQQQQQQKDEDQNDDEDSGEDGDDHDKDHKGHKKKKHHKHHDDSEEHEYYDHSEEDYNEDDYWKKKPKKTAVYSVGVGSAHGKRTWWGVLHPDVNSRSDIDLDSTEEDGEDRVLLVDDEDSSESEITAISDRGRSEYFLSREPPPTPSYSRPYPYAHWNSDENSDEEEPIIAYAVRDNGRRPVWMIRRRDAPHFEDDY